MCTTLLLVVVDMLPQHTGATQMHAIVKSEHTIDLRHMGQTIVCMPRYALIVSCLLADKQ